jgi:DNA polymerase IIIc chi subunit
LSSKNPLLGAIKLDDAQYPQIQNIKKREDTLVINIMDTTTTYNKNFLIKLLSKIKKSQRYLKEQERFHQLNSTTWEMNSSSAERNLIIEN